MNTKAISAMIQTHKLSCITRRKGNFVCSCGRDAAEAELAAMQSRIEKLEKATVYLFQACSNLCLPCMDMLEKEINAVSEALKGDK